MNAVHDTLLEPEMVANDLIIQSSSGQKPLLFTPSAITRPASFQGTVIGTFTGISEEGRPLVDFPANPQKKPVPAHSTVVMKIEDLGRAVVLIFEAADAELPIVVGLIQSPSAPAVAPAVEVRLDGEQLTLSAKQEIVLRCGKASITLTRAGKILIRGAYVLSRSSGANRIKGGSVQIN